jgi:hypothetical protein
MFKDIILSPWFQKLLRVWEKVKGIQLLGEPRMAPAAIVVLMFMLLRAKQPTHVLVLVAAWFYNVHPLLIFSVAGVVWLWAKVRKPRGYRAATAPKRTVDAIAEVRGPMRLGGRVVYCGLHPRGREVGGSVCPSATWELFVAYLAMRRAW